MSQNKFDIVVFGATSFVGQILTHYLFKRHGLGGDLRWAIAGRSDTKMQALKTELGAQAGQLEMLVADAADEAALKALCGQARVVVSTVGPYALYGSPLVKACVESGTDYCDLTGEIQWVVEMIKAHEATAQKTGARIVHCCGFDSIPSDLGVHFLQQQGQKQYGQPFTRVKLRVKSMRGGFSGGTAASLMNVVKEATQDAALRKLLANPYAACPDTGGRRVPQPNVTFAEYDPDYNCWTAPFVMAGINTRVVHRSNALSGGAYGDGFVYDEAMLTGRGLKGRLSAMAVGSALGGFLFATALPPTRWLLQKFVVPQPGEGPSPQEQENGFYDMRLFGRTADGRTLKAKVTGDRDPGYGSTGKILGEAAVSLARDVPRTEKPGGFWTPATIFGDKLIQRLTAHAGLDFELLE
jgi:short subunit dehydrogenase-like uncharacterized protein